MEEDQGAGDLAILRRLLRYAEKVYRWSELLGRIQDHRKRPRHSTTDVVSSVAVCVLSRLGSLNAIEQTGRVRFWNQARMAAPPSADTIGRVFADLEPDTLRDALHRLYGRLARNKALLPVAQGLRLAVLDGHESHASYRRHCSGCLTRTITAASEDRIQYYHRHVTAMLWGKPFCLLLDAEAQKPGEDEIATAIRLLERLLARYPRAFDVVGGDALYADPRLFGVLKAAGKYAIAVLKQDHPALLEEARALCDLQSPISLGPQVRAWDITDVHSWTSVKGPVRIVRTQEELKNGKTSEWVWVTTLPDWVTLLSTATFGRARWCIENQGFNETVSFWHANHVYRHHPTAVLTFTLLTYLVCNLFHAFFYRDLKPALQRKFAKRQIARFLLADLFWQPRPSLRPP